MKATNWHRRHIEVTRQGTIHVSTHFAPKPVVVMLHLDTFVGDAVERVRAELTLDEAKKLRDTLGRMIASAETREVEEQVAKQQLVNGPRHAYESGVMDDRYLKGDV